jgi:hypothetical protein
MPEVVLARGGLGRGVAQVQPAPPNKVLLSGCSYRARVRVPQTHPKTPVWRNSASGAATGRAHFEQRAVTRIGSWSLGMTASESVIGLQRTGSQYGCDTCNHPHIFSAVPDATVSRT